jgi:hypothetical protein
MEMDTAGGSDRIGRWLGPYQQNKIEKATPTSGVAFYVLGERGRERAREGERGRERREIYVENKIDFSRLL